MTNTEASKISTVTGGVDTHKDLHVAAVVDDHNRLLATASFPTTRQGYGKMLTWMRSHGDLHRVGVECTGSYGAGLLRFFQQAGIEVLEVTTPDRLERRRKGKNGQFEKPPHRGRFVIHLCGDLREAGDAGAGRVLGH